MMDRVRTTAIGFNIRKKFIESINSGEGGSHGQTLFVDTKVISIFLGLNEDIHGVSPNSQNQSSTQT
jgi:hypothetical protein